jgi:hypothetical protein
MSDRTIDWRALAEALGAVTYTEGGRNEIGGTKTAEAALTFIVGDDLLRDAVDYCVTGESGAETARSVLRLLRPQVARDRCMEIFRAAEGRDQGAYAIYLLSDVADLSVLEWIPEIQANPNPLARAYSVRIIDQLWMIGDIEPDEGRPFLEATLRDTDEMVRRAPENLLEMWERDAAIERGEDVD